MNLFKSHKPKVFCIGLNKTGTTTLEKVLKGFDYKLGNQVKGEYLLDAWMDRDFKQIIEFCKTAQAFQDIPFSLPYTYQFLDSHFKNAKFILSVRDSSEQWYDSLTKFHSKLWADNERIPNADDLKQATYRYRGFAFKFNQAVFQTPEDSPYDKEILIRFYETYNKHVMDYFKSHPEKLLIINVSKSSDYAKLCLFLNQPINAHDFPWENRT
jgi:hypothetical protein